MESLISFVALIIGLAVAGLVVVGLYSAGWVFSVGFLAGFLTLLISVRVTKGYWIEP